MALSLSRPHADGWFYDVQRPDRRMRVSWHPEQRLAVLSLWDGKTCSATFRLAVEDMAELSQAVVGFLGESVRAAPPPRSRTRWIDRIRLRLRPALAEVIHLVDRRPLV